MIGRLRCQTVSKKDARWLKDVRPSSARQNNADFVSDDSQEKKEPDVQEPNDPIKPNHYKKGIEPLAFIQSWGLGFELGNLVKYVVRAKYKGTEIEDLKKAAYYLQRYIEHRESQIATPEK
jgi:hypothetical protein